MKAHHMCTTAVEPRSSFPTRCSRTASLPECSTAPAHSHAVACVHVHGWYRCEPSLLTALGVRWFATGCTAACCIPHSARVMLSSFRYFITEECGQVTVDIIRCGDAKGRIEVEYEVEKASQDLKGGKGSAMFEPGVFSQSVVLTYAFRHSWQPDETFLLKIALKGGGATLGCSKATVHILRSKAFATDFEVAVGGASKPVRHLAQRDLGNHARSEQSKRRDAMKQFRSFLKQYWNFRGKQARLSATIGACCRRLSDRRSELL